MIVICVGDIATVEAARERGGENSDMGDSPSESR